MRNPWWPLVFLAHSNAGLYFAYETAGALAPDLQEQMGFTNNQIGLLYSAYSMPIIFSIFVSGYLTRKIGVAKCVLLFSFLISVGTFIIAIAPNFGVMFAGQILYGTGSSPLYLTSVIIMGKWFGTDAIAKRKISISFGIVFAWYRFFSFAAFVLLPKISENVSLRFALIFSALVSFSSFASGLIFFLVDCRKRYTLNAGNENQPSKVQMQPIELKTVKNKSPEKLSLLADDVTTNGTVPDGANKTDGTETDGTSDGTTYIATTTNNIIATSDQTTTNGNGYVDDNEQEQVKGEGEEGRTERKGGDEMEEEPPTMWEDGVGKVWMAIRGFPVAYWIVALLCILFISDLYTTTAFLTNFLFEEWGFSKESASVVTSFVCLSNVITSPVAGWLAGYTGWRVKFIILGSMNLVLIHSLFAFSQNIPAVVLSSALGLTQSIMDTNLTPSVVFLVARRDYTLAMSIVSILYNGGLLLLAALCGLIRDVTHTWLFVNVTFITISVLAVLLSIILKVVDWKSGNVLDQPFIKHKT